MNWGYSILIAALLVCLVMCAALIESGGRTTDALTAETRALQRFMQDNAMLEQQFRDLCEEEPKPRHSSCKWFLENYSTRG